MPSFPDFTDNFIVTCFCDGNDGWTFCVCGSLCISEHAQHPKDLEHYLQTSGRPTIWLVEEMSRATTPPALNSWAYVLKSFILASLLRMHLESEVVMFYFPQ